MYYIASMEMYAFIALAGQMVTRSDSCPCTVTKNLDPPFVIVLPGPNTSKYWNPLQLGLGLGLEIEFKPE